MAFQTLDFSDLLHLHAIFSGILKIVNPSVPQAFLRGWFEKHTDPQYFCCMIIFIEIQNVYQSNWPSIKCCFCSYFANVVSSFENRHFQSDRPQYFFKRFVYPCKRRFQLWKSSFRIGPSPTLLQSVCNFLYSCKRFLYPANVVSSCENRHLQSDRPQHFFNCIS